MIPLSCPPGAPLLRSMRLAGLQMWCRRSSRPKPDLPWRRRRRSGRKRETLWGPSGHCPTSRSHPLRCSHRRRRTGPRSSLYCRAPPRFPAPGAIWASEKPTARKTHAIAVPRGGGGKPVGWKTRVIHADRNTSYGGVLHATAGLHVMTVINGKARSCNTAAGGHRSWSGAMRCAYCAPRATTGSQVECRVPVRHGGGLAGAIGGNQVRAGA